MSLTQIQHNSAESHAEARPVPVYCLSWMVASLHACLSSGHLNVGWIYPDTFHGGMEVLEVQHHLWKCRFTVWVSVIPLLRLHYLYGVKEECLKHIQKLNTFYMPPVYPTFNEDWTSFTAKFSGVISVQCSQP